MTAAGIMIAAAAACIAAQQWRDARLVAGITAAGLLPWPAGADGADHLFWLRQPGHLLHVMGILGDREWIDLVLLGLTAFLVAMAWTMRRTAAVYLFLPLGIGLSILFTGTFFTHPGPPIDFAMDLDRGRFLDHGVPIASVCDIASIGIRATRAGRTGYDYTLTGRKRDGGTADLVTLTAPGQAEALRSQITGDVAGLECPATP